MAQDLERILELLREIQSANTSSTRGFDRLLNDISVKVNDLNRDSVSADLIKSYLSDLTISVENKYSATSGKFAEIEQALNEILRTQKGHAKNKDMKELFDAFVKNLNNFYAESAQQKTILSAIEAKISELGSDKSAKEDILHTISLIRNDFENVNNGYKNTIDTVSSDLKSVIANLIKLDQSKATEKIQAQVETLYNAVNDIATYLKSIDKHEANLEILLNNTATSESLKLTNAAIDTIKDKTDEIILTLSEMSTKSDIGDLQIASRIINDGVVNIPNKEEFSVLTQKTEDLLDDTNEFKKTLAKITKNLGLVLDKSTLEESLQKLYSHLNSIQDDIIGTNVTSNVIELDNKLSLFNEELATIRNIVNDLEDVVKNKITTLLEDISFEQEGYEIKTYVSKLLTHLPQKDDIDRLLRHQETGEKTIADLMTKTDDLLDRLDNLPTHADMAGLNTNQTALVENLQVVSTKDDIENLISKADDIEEMIDKLNFDDEFSQLYDKTSSIETWLQESKIKENSEEILSKLSDKSDSKDMLKVMETLDLLVNNIEDLSRNTDAKKVNRTVSELYQIIDELKNEFLNTVEVHNDSLLVNLSEMQKTLSGMVNGSEFNNFIDDLKLFVEKLNKDIEVSGENFDKISQYQDSILEKLDGLNTGAIGEIIDSRFEQIDNKLINLSEFISNIPSNFAQDLKNSIFEIKEILSNKKSNVEVDEKFGKKVSKLFETYFTDIKSLLTNEENTLSKEILEQINSLEDKVGNYTSSGNHTLSKILEKLEETGKILEKTVDNEAMNSSIQEISELNKSVIELGNSFKELAQNKQDGATESAANFISKKLTEISEDIKNLTSDIDTKMHSAFSYNSALIEEKTEALSKFIEELKANKSTTSDLDEKLSVAESKLSDTKQELELINTDVVAVINANHEHVLKQLNQIKEMFEQYKSMSAENLQKTVLQDLAKLNEEISDLKINDNSVQIEQLQDSYKKISSELSNNLRDFVLGDIDSLIIKLDDLKYEIHEDMSKLALPDAVDMEEFREFLSNIDEFRKEQKSLIDDAVLEVKSAIDEKITQSKDELASLLSVAANNDKIISAIDDFKSDILQKITSFESGSVSGTSDLSLNSYEKEFETPDYKELIPAIKADFKKFTKYVNKLSGDNTQISKVMASIKDKLDTLYEAVPVSAGQSRIRSVSEDNFDIIQALDYLKEDIQGLKVGMESSVSKEFKISEELDKNNELVVEAIYGVLSGKEWLEHVKNYLGMFEIQSVLDEIKDKLEVIALADPTVGIPEIKQVLEEIKSAEASVSENPEIISALKLINDKIDILAAADNTEIFEEFRDAIETLSYENTEKNVENDNLLKLLSDKIDVIASSESIDDQITEMLDVLNKKVDVIASTDGFDEQIADMLEELHEKVDSIGYSRQELLDIKDLISTQSEYLKNVETNDKTEALQKCLNELSAEVNNLSSNSDAQDIKQTVREMKESIMSAVVSVFEQISFVEESEDIKDFVEEKTDEINRNLEQVTDKLKQIVNANEEDTYTYSMQDIESDLAKMRLALSELQQNEQANSEERLNSILDNINQLGSSVESLQNSISSDSGEELQSKFDKINSDLTGLSKLTNRLMVTSGASYDVITQNLNSKVDNVTKLIEKSHESDKVMRQALIYMGEWIDSASDSMNKIKTNSDEITDIKTAIDVLKSNIPEQTDMLNIIGEKFDEQQQRLSYFEKQIEKLSSLEERFDSQQERIDRIEMSIDKILNAVEDIDDSKVSKKIDKIDKQLSKLSTYVERLAQYVE